MYLSLYAHIFTAIAFGRCAENISTFVDEMFAGTQISSVICHRCHMVCISLMYCGTVDLHLSIYWTPRCVQVQVVDKFRSLKPMCRDSNKEHTFTKHSN